jgi:hypothetical protein
MPSQQHCTRCATGYLVLREEVEGPDLVCLQCGYRPLSPRYIAEEDPPQRSAKPPSGPPIIRQVVNG